jgi:hypothetical protein
MIVLPEGVSLPLQLLGKQLRLQAWRWLGEGAAEGLGKYIMVANHDADLSSKEWLVYKGRVLGEGGKSEKLVDWLAWSFKWVVKKGFVPEVHLSNCWILGGEPVSFDIIIDLEPAELEVQLERATRVMKYLKMYGVKAACKVSSIRNGLVGLHVYADLHVLWRLGLEEKWEEFYLNLLDHLSQVYGIPLEAMDSAFRGKHNYRAFNSPRALKGEPSRFNCFNVPVNVKEYLELAKALGWDKALAALEADALQPAPKLPLTGVFDADGFLALFRGLTSLKLHKDVEQEAAERVLHYKHKLYRSNPKVRWIERVLEHGLEDGRKRFVFRCAAPYLAQLVKRSLLSESEALAKLQEFNKVSAEKAKKKPLPTAFLRGQLGLCLRKDVRPMSLAKFLEENPDLKPAIEAVLALQGLTVKVGL